LEVLPDPSLPKSGPGRWGQTGNFILDEVALTMAPGSGNAATNVFFSKATADWEQQYYRAEHAVDRNPKTGWAIGPKFGQRHFLIAELAQPLSFNDGARLGFRLDSYHGNNHTIGRLRLSVTAECDPAALWPVPPAGADAHAGPTALAGSPLSDGVARHPEDRAGNLPPQRAGSRTGQCEVHGAGDEGGGAAPGHAHSRARKFFGERQASHSRRARGATAVGSPSANQSPGPGAVARKSGKSADRARHGESPLGAGVWHGHC